MDPVSVPTLYDDWCLRRERLVEEQAKGGDGYREVLVKLLDYLLKRYEKDDAVRRPARFPLISEVVWKRRTMVVHRHLSGRDDHAPVRDAGEAQTRASRILSHIAAQAPQKAAGTPGGGALGGVDLSELVARSIESIPGTLKAIPRDLTHRTLLLRTHFMQLEPALQHALLTKWFQHLLPQNGTAPLWEDPKCQESWSGLSGCSHPDALDYVFQLWKEYVLTAGCDKGLAETEGFLRLPSHRERAADLLRAELADDRLPIRLRALMRLRELGSLDDVGLLSDLLALSGPENEDAGEREAMVETLKALAGS